MNTRILVVEHEPDDPPAQFGDWLAEYGVDLDVVQAWAGSPLPASLAGYDGFLVMGGWMSAHHDEEVRWLSGVKQLIREAASAGVPTLGICLGHQVAAVALGGHVGRNPAGKQFGLVEVGFGAAAANDPLFGRVVDFAPDSPQGIHWNDDIVGELPDGAELLDAVLLDELQDAALAHVQRADHRLQVAVGDPRRADVRHDDVPDGVDVPAALDDLQRRDPQALLEDLGGVAGEPARHLAADLRHVPDAGGEGDELVAGEHRLDDAVLREVAAAPERVVVEDHVAGVEVLLADLEDRPLDDVDDGAEVRGAELRLGDHLAAVVEDRAREVQALVEEGRVGRVPHRDAHLAGGRDEVVVDDLEGDLVDGCGRVAHRVLSSGARRAVGVTPASRAEAGSRTRRPRPTARTG